MEVASFFSQALQSWAWLKKIERTARPHGAEGAMGARPKELKFQKKSSFRRFLS